MILHTHEEITHCRRNVAHFDWSQKELAELKERCRPWLLRSDDELWSMLPGQSVPRGIHVNENLGCPSCGRDLYHSGSYPWIITPDIPWKLTCPSCGEIWPRNDFDAFHRSGLTTGGVFRRDHADESLLTSPTDEIPAIDDGMGWVDDGGNRWWFIAYYAHFGIWTWVPQAAMDLATVYLYTADASYAHKALILLDRIADLYPEMDLAPYSAMNLYNSHGGTGKGRIKGCIWETGLAETLARAWDIVSDYVEGDAGAAGFLSRKAEEWGILNDKSTPEKIRENVEVLLREFMASCRDGRISGNEGMTQTTMATAAAVLDDPKETPEGLDWLFQQGSRKRGGGGHIPQVLVGEVDRDGIGNEAAPGYAFLWLETFRRCADVLSRCTKHRDYDLYRDFPRIRAMHMAPYLLTALDAYTPHIGDSGQTGNPGMTAVKLSTAVAACETFGEPFFAQLAFKLNGNTIEGLHTSIFSENPEAIRSIVGDAVREHGELTLESADLNGYGLTMFRTAKDDGRRAAWLYYGRSIHHGHRDRLNIGIYYRGMDILPDLGYPEYADASWPKRAGWTKNTISHNTVVVDRKAQRGNWTGHSHIFVAGDSVYGTEVSSPEVYPGLSEYRRTLVMIDLDESESYFVDFFRVEGGSDHLLSFHAGEGEVTSHGVAWTAQTGGTYAGEEVARGVHFDGEPDGRYRGSGFSYLSEVRRATPTTRKWWVDWDLTDGWSTKIGEEAVHLRFHSLSRLADAALAEGIPPVNHPGNPERLHYLLLHRPATRSLFCSVIEPYSGEQQNLVAVDTIELPELHNGISAAAVRVETRHGEVHHILSSLVPSDLYDLGEGVRAAARFAVIRRARSGALRILTVGGTRIDTPSGTLLMEKSEYTGTVMDFSRGDLGPLWIDTTAALPVGKRLRGARIRFHASGDRDACYTIESISDAGEGIRRIDLGESTFACGIDDAGEFSYIVSPGDSFDVQIVIEATLDRNGLRISRGPGNGLLSFLPPRE